MSNCRKGKRSARSLVCRAGRSVLLLRVERQSRFIFFFTSNHEEKAWHTGCEKFGSMIRRAELHSQHVQRKSDRNRRSALEARIVDCDHASAIGTDPPSVSFPIRFEQKSKQRIRFSVRSGLKYLITIDRITIFTKNVTPRRITSAGEETKGPTVGFRRPPFVDFRSWLARL